MTLKNVIYKCKIDIFTSNIIIFTSSVKLNFIKTRTNICQWAQKKKNLLNSNGGFPTTAYEKISLLILQWNLITNRHFCWSV